MYYMTFISRCLGMLKSRNDKLVWAKDELKKYLRHHIIHEYDHIFRLNRHNGTTLVPGHDLICSTWCCGPVAGSHPANLNTTAGKYMSAPSPLLPPCYAHTQTHTNTHKDTFFRQTAARKVCPGSKHNAAVLCAKMVDVNIVHVWIYKFVVTI